MMVSPARQAERPNVDQNPVGTGRNSCWRNNDRFVATRADGYRPGPPYSTSVTIADHERAG
jgi:hypothetical protein